MADYDKVKSIGNARVRSEIQIPCQESIVTLYTCRKIYTNYCRVLKRFDFDESQTVDFHDIFDGPAAIRVVPSFLGKKRQVVETRPEVKIRVSCWEMVIVIWKCLIVCGILKKKKNPSPVMRRQSSQSIIQTV